MKIEEQTFPATGATVAATERQSGVLLSIPFFLCHFYWASIQSAFYCPASVAHPRLYRHHSSIFFLIHFSYPPSLPLVFFIFHHYTQFKNQRWKIRSKPNKFIAQKILIIKKLMRKTLFKINLLPNINFVLK